MPGGTSRVPPAEARWRERNPLRVWLDAGVAGERVHAVMKATGVVRQTVYAWIYGLALPGPEKFQALKIATGNVFGWDEWLAWWSRRPK